MYYINGVKFQHNIIISFVSGPPFIGFIVQYSITEYIVVKHAKVSWERRLARLAGGFGRMVRSP